MALLDLRPLHAFLATPKPAPRNLHPRPTVRKRVSLMSGRFEQQGAELVGDPEGAADAPAFVGDVGVDVGEEEIFDVGAAADNDLACGSTM